MAGRIIPNFIRLAALCLMLLSTGKAASALMIGDSTVSYSATRIVVFKGKTYVGHVWAEPGRQRHEQDIQGLQVVVILRADTNMAEVLLPSFNVYARFEMSDDLDVGNLGKPIERRKIAGVAVAKYKLHHDEADGSGADAALWLTAQNILLRLDGEYRTTNGTHVPVTASLSHIEKGDQDPGLFEIPAGMTELPVEAVAPMLGVQIK